MATKKTHRKKIKIPIPQSNEVIKLKKYRRWVVFAVCIAWLLTLLGCGKEKPFMLDGPQMEYQSPWTAFTISRIDSNTRYHFWFTVTDDGDQPLVTGECRDKEGNSYMEETGIAISAEDLWQLRWMDLDQLPEKEIGVALPADAAGITLTLTLSDGTVVQKNASSDLSIGIYTLLLPYLKNN